MDAVTGSRLQVVPFPWTRPGDGCAVGCPEVRACVIAPADCEEVTCDVCEESLPQLSIWSDADGNEWKVFELPGGETRDTGEPETARVSGIARSRTDYFLTSAALPSLPKGSGAKAPGMDDIGEDTLRPQSEPTTEGEMAARTVDRLISLHLEFVNRLYDSARISTDYWEGQVSGVAVRSARRAVAEWRRAVRDKGEPRMALIVKLARDLPETLSDVCRRPRRVLRRVREVQRADKIQELDAACLRWIARQPGITLLEKAGPKQELLGVVRLEDADTPENRVVRDLLLRLRNECQRYLAEHHQFFDHNRVRLVRHLLVLVRNLWHASPVAQAGALVGIASPNYVLQHEHRYNVLWNAYVMLVRQQKQHDSAWRWRHRIWAEQCWVALLAALRKNSVRSCGMKSDLLLRDEQVSGRFIDHSTQIGAWTAATSPETAIYFVDGRCHQLGAGVPRWLSGLCPDVVLVAETRTNRSHHRRILAVWTVFACPSDDESLELHARQLSETVSQHQTGGDEIRCLLLEPGQGSEPEAKLTQVGDCQGMRLSLPLQDHLCTLAGAVQRGLRLPC